MTNLYKNTDWSQKTLEEPISLAKKQVTKSKINVISMEYLKHYHEELTKRTKEGHISSFTELWSLVQEAFLRDEVRTALPRVHIPQLRKTTSLFL